MQNEWIGYKNSSENGHEPRIEQETGSTTSFEPNSIVTPPDVVIYHYPDRHLQDVLRAGCSLAGASHPNMHVLSIRT
jgi:hypothetical protein